MEGTKEKSKNPKTVDGLRVNSSQESPSLPTPNTSGRTPSRILELRTLLSSLEYPQQKWPDEALKSVVLKFVRMPSTGWRIFKEIYVEKFKIDVSMTERKRIAEHSISSQAGMKCSRDRFISESNKRQKTVEDFLDEKSSS